MKKYFIFPMKKLSQVDQQKSIRAVVASLFLFGSSLVNADFLCSYENTYGLMTNGTLKAYYQKKGRQFTINMDGATGGDISGDYEVYDDGKKLGYSFKAMKPWPFSYDQRAAKINKQRDIPKMLYINTWEDNKRMPFILYVKGLIETGVCKKL